MRPVVLLVLAAVNCSPQEHRPRLTLDGAGPVTFAMGVREAMEALDRARVPHDTAAFGCGFLTARFGDIPLAFMVEGGRVVRVDVRDSSVTTPAGARIGLTEDSLQALYSHALVVRPHKYTDGHYLIYVSPGDTLRRFVFETDGKRVTEWRSGLYPPVEYVEGCS